MGEMFTAVEKYGIGLVATSIIFAGFLYYIKESIKNQKEHNINQVSALTKVAESNDNVAEALKLIRDMFIDRTNSIENKQDITINTLKAHCTDVVRIEAMVNKLQDSVLKTDERTKQCAERSNKFRKGDSGI